MEGDILIGHFINTSIGIEQAGSKGCNEIQALFVCFQLLRGEICVRFGILQGTASGWLIRLNLN